MVKRLSIVFLYLICFSLISYAQGKRDSFEREITASAGVYASFLENSGSDLTLGLSYGQFNYNGLGYTAGFQYIASVANVNDFIGFPVAISFRGRHKSGSERLESVAGNAARSARANGGDNRNTLANALLGLFNQTQIFAGVTPGYIFGKSSKVGWSKTGKLSHDEFWTERKSPLYLSLDGGINFNCSIWRFDLRLQPAVHYWLTNNLVTHYSVVDEISGPLSDKTSTPRWFFSMSAGLSFKF